MTSEHIQVIAASTRLDKSPAPKFICSGCGRSQRFGVKITSHMVIQMNGILGECSGVGSLPVPSEISSSTLRIRNPHS